jgi:cellulose synthase/poly-beta-1,6-N-acetylglucosamine synthase-like glycosyltransferase
MRKLMHQKKGEVLDNIHSRTSLLDWSSSMRIFIRQRIRWARGLVQTLYLHREVLLIQNMAKQVCLFFLITLWICRSHLRSFGITCITNKYFLLTLTSII